jgi:hypothetical protein
MLGAPGAVHTRAREEANRWARDPTSQPHRGGGSADRAVLAAGELTGGEVTTIVIPVLRRSRWCKRHDQRSSGIGSSSPMAERRRGWSPAAHPRPCHDQRKGARAMVSHGEQDARARREKGGAEESGPQSGKLWRARLCSGEQFTRRGGLPRPAGASTGCARERRSSGQDGGVDGETERPERQRRRWRAVAEAGLRLLLLARCCEARRGNGGGS